VDLVNLANARLMCRNAYLLQGLLVMCGNSELYSIILQENTSSVVRGHLLHFHSRIFPSDERITRSARKYFGPSEKGISILIMSSHQSISFLMSSSFDVSSLNLYSVPKRALQLLTLI
jgi:hypothetical protein